MPGLSLRAYARHRARLGLPGRSLAAVQKAIESRRIAVGADGLLDPELADRQWLEHTEQRLPPVGGREKSSSGHDDFLPPALQRIERTWGELLTAIVAAEERMPAATGSEAMHDAWAEFVKALECPDSKGC